MIKDFDEIYLQLIKDTLKRMGQEVHKGLDNESAIELIYETAITESGEFKYYKQIKGPAIGFTQLEPNTIWDIWENYVVYRDRFSTFLLRNGWVKYDWKYAVLGSLVLQIALTRIHYFRVPEKLPTTPLGRAKYWKKYYNTVEGKGTVDHYLELNNHGLVLERYKDSAEYKKAEKNNKKEEKAKTLKDGE